MVFEQLSVDQICPGRTDLAILRLSMANRSLGRSGLRMFFTDPDGRIGWEGVEVHLTSPEVGASVVRAYLSAPAF